MQITHKRKFYKPNFEAIFEAKKECSKLKVIDMDNVLSPILDTNATNAQVFLLSTMQQGTGMNQRVGRVVYYKHLIFRGALSPTTFGSYDVIRIAVVYDRQPSGGAIPAYSTIFNSIPATGGGGATALSDINIDSRQRFVVLRDMHFQTPPVISPTNYSTATSAALEMNGKSNIIDEYIELQGLDCVFNNTHNPITSADISTGALYLVFEGINPTSTMTTGACWMCLFHTRLSYTDVSNGPVNCSERSSNNC